MSFKKMSGNKKIPFYAEPGADDKYLRPRLGGGFAPRKIAVTLAGDSIWMSWIHRRKQQEYLVASLKKPGSKGRFFTIDTNAKYFSKPSFRRLPGEPPEILCAVGNNLKWEIRAYRFCGGRWHIHDKLPVMQGPVYQIDALASDDGGAWLAYSSISKDNPGLSVYTRRLAKGSREDENAAPFKSASLNRPKLSAGENGVFYLTADAYADKNFRIVFKTLAGKSAGSWETVPGESGWNFFPSMAVDAEGRPWIAWLNQRLSRRGALLGFRQEVFVAMLADNGWHLVRDKNHKHAVNLNLGLLPVKRYFGYAGLRRYPRLKAFTDGTVALLWEQQKGEEEIWENAENGLLCARRFVKGEWEQPVVLHDGGVCHAFDEKGLQSSAEMLIAVKSRHQSNGDDFQAAAVNFEKAKPYRGKPARLWQGWTSQRLPVNTGTRNRPSIRQKGKKPWKLFWADMHCHSVFSPDAEGEPDELYLFARDVARIDIAGLTDNDFYPNKILLDSEVNFLGELSQNLTRDGRFIPFAGFEWTYHRKDAKLSFNHRIVIFPGGKCRVARRNEPEGYSEKAFRRYLTHTRYFNFPHHAFWHLLGSPGERCVEVCSAWGPYILDADTIVQALQSGKKFGFMGNSDSHRFMPGFSGALTGIYAESLTREAVLDALEKRRCFATTGNRTEVAFWIDSAFMGQSVHCSKAPHVRWRVRAQGTLESVEIKRDGDTVLKTDTSNGDWTDKKAARGKHWYVLQVKESGRYERHPHNVAPAFGKYAWSSPIWVTIEKQLFL
ncbi:MAG: DUF3604 domain-containing protein [Candidatus Omnitrophica bacterium]|nr:DUF3604 domain-containing protein [Candidatus Omnitrophota bacterium]